MSRRNKQLTPKETVHSRCHYCVQSRHDAQVISCGGDMVYATGKPCPFFPYRAGKRSPMKVFRQFCLECMGGSPSLVRECEKEDCLMYSYRFGKNPSIKGSDRERMEAIRPPGSTFSPAKSVQNQLFLTGDGSGS
jgi:hypothetical protein